MERRVRRVLRVCDLCQKSKVVNYRVEGEMNYIKVERPFDLVAVDLYGPLPRGDVYKRQNISSVRDELSLESTLTESMLSLIHI